jgi:hypothetical protein
MHASVMAFTKDNPEPLGPLWDLVFPLVFGHRKPEGFDIAGVAGTAFVPAPGVVVSCAHCFGGLDEWEYALAKVVVDESSPVGLITDIALHPDGYDLAVGRVSDARFRPLPPFELKDAGIGADVLAPGYPLPRRWRRSMDEPVQFEVTVRGLRGHVTSDGIVSGLGQYGSLPSVEVDMQIPGGLSGAPLFDWGFIQNPLKLVGVVRGTSVLLSTRDEPFPADEDDDADEVERHTFGLASPAIAVASLRGPATDGRPLGEIISERWPY